MLFHLHLIMAILLLSSLAGGFIFHTLLPISASAALTPTTEQVLRLNSSFRSAYTAAQIFLSFLPQRRPTPEGLAGQIFLPIASAAPTGSGYQVLRCD